jgi:hypothetical protein
MESIGNGSAFQAVPEQLKKRDGWMASGGGIDGKAPTDAKGYDAPRAMSDVWRSFEAVVDEDLERGCGIGWVIQPGYVVFDLDDALDESGQLRKHFRPFVESVDTYVEKSISGKGLHAFVKSSVVPDTQKTAIAYSDGSKLEILAPGWYVRMTGEVYASKPSKVHDYSGTVRKALQEIREANGETTAEYGHAVEPGPGNSLTDEQILERAASARNGEKFSRLMDGDASAHDGDDSSADLALCNILRFWTGGDPEQMDRLFRTSGLMRDDKWDEVHHADGRTYGQGTIALSLKTRDFYDSEQNANDGSEKDKGSAADRLVSFALEDGRGLFVDQFGAAHVMARSAPLPLNSRCHGWLRQLMWDREGKTISGDALRTAAGTLAAFADNEGTVRELHTRAAWHEGALYYELHPGRVVRVDAGEWGVIESSPVLFRRLANLKPLPEPERGGSIEDICRFVNLKSERDRRLFCAYAVTLALPHVSRPILLATGAMGSGKSTTSRVIKRLWDPTEPEAIRTDPRDFLQKSSHCFVVMLDNQSNLSEAMADTLCRLVTGEADSKRKLYSDDEDIIYSLKRAILLNGINVPTERGDVLDRSLAVELERLSDVESKTEEEMWASFDEIRPKLLGEAFGLLSETIAAKPRLALTRTPRLADWGYYAAGVYEAMGWGTAKFHEDWDEEVEVQEQATLEGSPVAQAILLFMDEHPAAYEGTATQLYQKLEGVANSNGINVIHDKAWPRSPRVLWKRMKEVLPLLESRGIAAHRSERRIGTIIKLSKEADAA